LPPPGPVGKNNIALKKDIRKKYFYPANKISNVSICRTGLGASIKAWNKLADLTQYLPKTEQTKPKRDIAPTAFRAKRAL
jgi:hypothetical protein